MKRFLYALGGLLLWFALGTLDTAARLAAQQADRRITLHLSVERLDRTRIEVFYREGPSLITRRRLMPLSKESITVHARGKTDLLIVALDEGFNRVLDRDMLLGAEPGRSYRVTVTMMDALAILPER